MRCKSRIPFIVLSLTIVATISLLLVTACGRDNKQAFVNSTTPPPVATIAVQVASCPTGTADVIMQNEAFIPASITRPVNSSVKWTNNDIGTNNNYWIIFDGPDGKPIFESPRVGAGQSVCLEFSEPGTYNYHCDLAVKGTIIIEAPAK